MYLNSDICTTGAEWPYFRLREEFRGDVSRPLDAPEFIPAGGARTEVAEVPGYEAFGLHIATVRGIS